MFATMGQRIHLPGRGPANVLAAVCALFVAFPAHGELSAEELARLAQNPIANLVSVPFQNNTNFSVGPRDGTQNILNIQPVIPIELGSDWNLITRTIVPVVSQPGFEPGQTRTNGLGDIQFSAFLSPAKATGLVWGVGAIAQLPTNGNDRLGNDNWGLGPTFVVLHLEKGDPWVYGVLVNNVWSLSGDRQGGSYNNGLIQPFINYNLPGGTYLTSSPIVTVNWRASGSERWTVPLGGGVGHIFHFGRLPVNAQLSGYYNVARPDDAPSWQLRAQVQFMFPK
ncbi:neuromedin U [Accumulibacter sp.]|uniref:neuromedin U n=1 Tax=Accumulibacter sp. TaxID=2053492 RepID=UPI0025EC0BAF|nr:neuromedin U [Accumulibacter sp.]MCM8595630.1 transporter [Accumulibacter sp.]MCM8626051.1 transporter [Accumulibacter sp.]MDS4049777.1 neuromedin U [Accumulibacter sp.]